LDYSFLGVFGGSGNALILVKIRVIGRVTVAVASSRIAVILSTGRRLAHSSFKI
jgi:hypothetical protein